MSSNSFLSTVPSAAQSPPPLQPSPPINNSNNQEFFDANGNNTRNSDTKTCSYISGIKLKIPPEYGTSDHTAVLHDDNMYIYGGVSADNSLPACLQKFNFASRSFSTINPDAPPTARYQHTAVVHDGQMLVFGGGAENVFLNDLVAFSFEKKTWTEIVPKTSVRPSPRRGHTATIVGKHLYVFGGYGENGTLSDMYKFDFELKIWTVVVGKGTLPQARVLHTACVYNGAIYIYGGTNIEILFGDIFKFTCETNTWEEMPTCDSPVPSPRCSHTAVVLQESMYIIGGATDCDLLDAHEYNFETKKWNTIELTSQNIPREGRVSAVLRGDSVFLFGGITGPTHYQLDMLCLKSSDMEEELNQNGDISPSAWDSILLKKQDLLTRKMSHRSFSAKDPLNNQAVLNLVVECLNSLGCSRAANSIIEESKMTCLPQMGERSPQLDSRLVMILKVLKSRTRPTNLFDPEFTLRSARINGSESPEIVAETSPRGADTQEGEEEEVDIWSEPEDSRKNILRTKDENGKPIIRAANLNKLVQVLTNEREKVPDATFLRTFFYTYQSYTSPEMLLKKLIQKYHVKPEKGVVVDEKFKTEVLEPAQTRVCRVIKFWIEQCPWDFTGPDSERLFKSLNAFIDGTMQRDGNFVLVKQLRNSISKIMKKRPEEEKPITPLNPPEPKVPRNIFSNTLTFKDVDEVEIARQLTLLEFVVFSSVTPPEFLNKGWLDQNSKKSPRLKELHTRSMEVTRWVVYTILKCESKKARAKMLEKFIKVADQLKQIKNFQTMASIIAGFSHPAISRLAHMFNDISSNGKEIYQELVVFTKDDRMYREIMRSTPLPCIPNMEHTLLELANFHDTTPDKLNNLFHFQKQQQLYHHITRLQMFQQRPFYFLPVHQIAALISKIPKIADKELDEMSRKYE